MLKYLWANWPKKQADISNLIPNKIDFKPKLFKRDKEAILIIHQKQDSQRLYFNFNIYAPVHICKRKLVKIKTHKPSDTDSERLQ